MTTSVKVSAVCADDVEVSVQVGGDEAILQNGESKEFFIHDDVDLYVCEQSKDIEPLYDGAEEMLDATVGPDLDDLGDTTADSSSGTPAETVLDAPVDEAPVEESRPPLDTLS